MRERPPHSYVDIAYPSEPVEWVFGHQITSPDSAEPAEWFVDACNDVAGVGGLVPDRYPQVLRVWAPEPDDEDDSDDWWAAYCDLYEIVATVGARHTSTPDRAWFAVWEGHGYDGGDAIIGWWDEPRERAIDPAVEEERRQSLAEDNRRNAGIRAALRLLTSFVLPYGNFPYRRYYLLNGSVAAVTELRDPANPEQFRNPDLYWPDDRRWFVGTDVDFWSLF